MAQLTFISIRMRCENFGARSPGSNLISPGSVVSNSGTSSPFPGKCPIIEFRKGEPPKFLGYEHFSTRKWGSRVGSGSLTPSGWGSRLGSGTLTPNGGISRLGSGTVTPNGGEPPSRDSYLLENQISEVASLANSDNGSEIGEAVIDHRVSFELTEEDVPSCREKEPVMSHSQPTLPMDVSNLLASEMRSGSSMAEEKTYGSPRKASESGEDECHRKHRNITFGSSKDFDCEAIDKKLRDTGASGVLNLLDNSMPWAYSHVGTELRVDTTKSPFFEV